MAVKHNRVSSLHGLANTDCTVRNLGSKCLARKHCPNWQTKVCCKNTSESAPSAPSADEYKHQKPKDPPCQTLPSQKTCSLVTCSAYCAVCLLSLESGNSLPVTTGIFLEPRDASLPAERLSERPGRTETLQWMIVIVYVAVWVRVMDWSQ